MTLRRRIEAVMTGQGSQAPKWLKWVLTVMSLIYGSGVRLWRLAYDAGWIKQHRLPCMVISIGNITLGGTGKTPLTIYLAETIRRLGHHVVIISRGYGGSAERAGGVVSDGRRMLMRADESGDEPYMMAQRLSSVPILVGKNRVRSGLTAIENFRPDVILLDDGFQHRRLARDLDLVLLDVENPLGNGYLFPRGILREPAAALERANAVIFTRAGRAGYLPEERLQPYLESKPVFYSQHRPKLVKIIRGKPRPAEATDEIPLDKGLDFLKGKQVLAFAGIARNEDFFKSIPRFGCHLSEVVSFSDHHRYSRSDLERIRQAAADGQVDCLVTTEKDIYRISNAENWPFDLVVLGVDLIFEDSGFDGFIAERVAFRQSETMAQKDGP